MDDKIGEIKKEIRDIVDGINNNHLFLVGYAGSDSYRADLKKLKEKQSILDIITTDDDNKIKATKIFHHITSMLEDCPKYITSEACGSNLKLYFKWAGITECSNGAPV